MEMPSAYDSENSRIRRFAAENELCNSVVERLIKLTPAELDVVLSEGNVNGARSRDACVMGRISKAMRGRSWPH